MIESVAFRLDLSTEFKKLQSGWIEIEYGLVITGSKEKVNVFYEWLQNYFKELEK